MCSKHTVGIFYNSVNNIERHSHKHLVMNSFMKGVSRIDNVSEYHTKSFQIDTTITAGLLLGYTLENNFRKHIITLLENNGIPRIYIDSNILNYAKPLSQWHRYSINSVYPSNGVYFFGDINYKKWNTFSKEHGVKLKDWRKNGNHILILCQRSNGWNMYGNDPMKWIYDTISNISTITDRPIVVRLHPGDKYKNIIRGQLNHKFPHILVSNNDNIISDLHNCWCTVGYNSTPNVVSIIEGIPNIVLDPINSWANGCAGNDISMIESIEHYDRSQWIHKIANIHWSNDEIQSGILWDKIKEYISSVQL